MISQPWRRLVTLSPCHLVTLALFLAFLALYIRTAAPSVLSGDSAEFQFAAPQLGVPHPTTYPLYVLLGKLATLALPFGDLARRVTLVSAGCAALAVALFFRLAYRITHSIGGAAVAALALGFAPGLWNAATLAEVYALLMALLAGLLLLLAPTTDHRPLPTTADRSSSDTIPNITAQSSHKSSILSRPEAGGALWAKDADLRHSHPLRQAQGVASIRPAGLLRVLCRTLPNPTLRCNTNPKSKTQNPKSTVWRMHAAAFVAGLGCTHHGLFVIAALPLFAAALAWALTHSPAHPLTRSSPTSRFTHHVSRFTPLALCFAAGLAPLLYPLIQYARYGPFNGIDYGLPQHYFWGAPQSWSAVLDLLAGGAVRRGIFRLPLPGEALVVLRMVGARLLFEFGPLGLPLGALGCLALVRRRVAWAGATWVFLATLAYLLLLGPAVADAPVFTLPMLLPWALWIAAGTDLILSMLPGREQRTKLALSGGEGNKEPRTTQRVPDQEPRTESQQSPAHPLTRSPAHLALLALLLAATLAWGYTRLPYSSKRQLWLFRRFGEATLDLLPQGAVVLAHWEQGTTLQYLVLAERRRPDVWVDIVEPGDEAWGVRAHRRFAGRPVFFVGAPGDVAGLPVELVREDAYADVFRLRE